MSLQDIRRAVKERLRDESCLNAVPVLLEEDGWLPADWDKIAASKRLALTVGPVVFAPASRNAHAPFIAGMARFRVRVWERPNRNRSVLARPGPSAAEAAEAVASAVHLLHAGGGEIVCSGIGAVERVDKATVAVDVSFEVFVQLEKT